MFIAVKRIFLRHGLEERNCSLFKYKFDSAPPNRATLMTVSGYKYRTPKGVNARANYELGLQDPECI